MGSSGSSDAHVGFEGEFFYYPWRFVDDEGKTKHHECFHTGQECSGKGVFGAI